MHLQNSALCKWHATFGTGKWLLCSKDPLMGFQITTINKSLFTFWTDKWLFSCVGNFMCFQLTTSQIWLVTFATRKWLPSSMDPCMPFRLLPWLCVNGLSQKEQANDFPPVWTFSCVFKEWLWANRKEGSVTTSLNFKSRQRLICANQLLSLWSEIRPHGYPRIRIDGKYPVTA